MGDYVEERVYGPLGVASPAATENVLSPKHLLKALENVLWIAVETLGASKTTKATKSLLVPISVHATHVVSLSLRVVRENLIRLVDLQACENPSARVACMCVRFVCACVCVVSVCVYFVCVYVCVCV